MVFFDMRRLHPSKVLGTAGGYGRVGPLIVYLYTSGKIGDGLKQWPGGGVCRGEGYSKQQAGGVSLLDDQTLLQE